jgi:hypothetical protein
MRNMLNIRAGTFVLACGLTAGLSGCNPTITVKAPDKPIEINLNIRIEQEVRLKIDRELDKVFADDPALFGVTPTPVKPVPQEKKP